MPHPHTKPPGPGPKPVGSMVYRLRRQTPNAGYAEIEIVHHTGSHHSPGDVILISWEDYERGTFVEPPKAPPSPPPPPPFTKIEKGQAQAIEDFLALNPHVRDMGKNIPPKRSKPNANPRKPRKGKGKEAARQLR